MTYDRMIDGKDKSSIVLPLSQYTLVWWTESFQSVMNFIELRDEPTVMGDARIHDDSNR